MKKAIVFVMLLMAGFISSVYAEPEEQVCNDVDFEWRCVYRSDGSWLVCKCMWRGDSGGGGAGGWSITGPSVATVEGVSEQPNPSGWYCPSTNPCYANCQRSFNECNASTNRVPPPDWPANCHRENDACESLCNELQCFPVY